MWLWLVLACSTPAPEAPEVLAAPAPTWTATDSQAAMIRAFSLRDGSPPCAEVEALSTDALNDLRAIVAHVSLPPSAPMGAARCLIDHGAEAEPDMTAWLADPHAKGLALLATDAIPRLEPALGGRLKQAGLAGPHAEAIQKRLDKQSAKDISGGVVAPL